MDESGWTDPGFFALRMSPNSAIACTGQTSMKRVCNPGQCTEPLLGSHVPWLGNAYRRSDNMLRVYFLLAAVTTIYGACN